MAVSACRERGSQRKTQRKHQAESRYHYSELETRDVDSVRPAVLLALACACRLCVVPLPSVSLASACPCLLRSRSLPLPAVSLALSLSFTGSFALSKFGSRQLTQKIDYVATCYFENFNSQIETQGCRFSLNSPIGT